MGRTFPFRARDGREGIVRPARSRDARACLRIVSEAVAERPRTLAVLEEELWTAREWRAHRVDWGRRGTSLVAELDGEVVGQLTCERSNRTVTMHSADLGITVRSDARGIGVGRALMRALEEWAREYGVDRITLGVFAGNDRAIGLYRALGYAEEGVDRGAVRFPEGDVDVVRMAKVLGRARPPGAPGDLAGRARDYDEPRPPRGAMDDAEG